MSLLRVPCVLIRGGTSKGVFFHERDLPTDPDERKRVILSIVGAGDPRQIDGLGGADPLTSKIAIIRPSRSRNADVDYTFGQVGVAEATLDESLNCGNLAAGAAIFAIDEGLVRAEEPVTIVRIWNVNTSILCVARVLVADGEAASEGDFAIDGVPGTGAPVELRYAGVAGAVTGRLLPTGFAHETLRLECGAVDVTIVDAGNLYAFVDASALGLVGSETPRDIASRRDVMDRALAVLRGSSARLGGVAVKKLGILSRAAAGGEAPEVTCRIVSANGTAHAAFAVTGAIALGFAAFVERTIVRRTLSREPERRIRIHHPQGTLDVAVECALRHGARIPSTATIFRTARRLMEGLACVPATVASALPVSQPGEASRGATRSGANERARRTRGITGFPAR